jgi:hypothetical protein
MDANELIPAKLNFVTGTLIHNDEEIAITRVDWLNENVIDAHWSLLYWSVFGGRYPT